jgi:hypothetical protein
MQIITGCFTFSDHAGAVTFIELPEQSPWGIEVFLQPVFPSSSVSIINFGAKAETGYNNQQAIDAINKGLTVGSARNIRYNTSRFITPGDTLALFEGVTEAIEFVDSNTDDFKVPFHPAGARSTITVH